MPPPTISWSTLSASVSSTCSLVDTLAPPTMATMGRFGCASAFSSASSSATSRGPAQATGRQAGHAVRRRLGAVRRAEGIHDEDITQVRIGAGERFIVALFTGIEAHVFQQHDLPVSHLDAAAPVVDEAHRLRQQPRQVVGHRGQGVLLVEFTLRRAAEVRHQHDPGPGVERHAHGRQGGADARIGADGTVLNRDVEILADQHATSCRSTSSIRVTDRDMRLTSSQ
jgi:hypothetical protein